MAYTLMQYALSSVFLTPDHENQSPIQTSHATPRPYLPHLAILLSPAVTPKFSTAKDPAPDADVLTGLIEAGTPRCADLILAHLSPSDIVASMQVSHKWHEMVTSRQNLMDKVTSYRWLCKSNAENLPKRVNKPLYHQTQLPRQPLSNIAPNIQLRSSNLPSTSTLPSDVHQSPTQALDKRRAVGMEGKLDICSHQGECPTRSLKRPQSTGIATTQMCKKRLRRL